MEFNGFGVLPEGRQRNSKDVSRFLPVEWIFVKNDKSLENPLGN